MAITDNLVRSRSLNTNGTISDNSGNGGTGTINGATYTADGKFSGGYVFDGSNDCISFSDWGHSNFDSGYTYSLRWKMPATLPTSDGIAIGTDYFYMRYLQSSKRFRVADYSGSVEPIIETADNTAVANTWFHLMAVYNGSTLYFYINNTQVGQSSLPSVADADRGFNLGCYGAFGIYAAGTIDEVNIWSRAITEAERNLVSQYPYPFTATTPFIPKITIY